MKEENNTPHFDVMSDDELALWHDAEGSYGMTEKQVKRAIRAFRALVDKARGFEILQPNHVLSRSNKLRSFDIRNIHVLPGRRALNESTVIRLMESIERIGLQSPPSVRIVDEMVIDGVKEGSVPVLVAGRHRLEAMRRLGHMWITCVVLNISDVDAELTEISENLHRAELTVLQRDEQIARWIDLTTVREESEVLRQLDAKPEATKSGRPEGGVRAAARELNLSEPDARRAVKVAALSPEAKVAAVDAGLDDNRSALLEAAKQTEPERQVVVLRDWKQEAKRLKDVNKDLRGKIEARDAMERVDARLAREHSTRAMFAEADKERCKPRSTG